MVGAVVRTPAEQLAGLSLDGGWRVLELIPRPPGATGGYFSQSYLVKDDNGRQAFLKALDYSKALRDADPALRLKRMTEAFVFERELLRRCRSMSRIVTAIADGSVTVGNRDTDVVQYIIFELADGDIRSQADIAQRFDLAVSLRALHQIATGLFQLHRHRIAHQDLKPSNVMVFPRDGSKLSDLGRACYGGLSAPHDDDQIPGDWSYAPPELLYGQIDPDWNRRRMGCDAYHLGSMIVFLFSGAGLTPQLLIELRDEHRMENWRSDYAEVLPYVRDAFERVVSEFWNGLPEHVRDRLVTIVRQLCEPDPTLRGHPRTRAGVGNQYSLERYVSEFNILATKAEMGLKRP